MRRVAGTYVAQTTLGVPVQAFVPHALPPSAPALAESAWVECNRAAELALARLSAVAGLVPSVDWLLYSAIRKEALMTSQIEGTQAALTDLFDDEAGLVVSNTDDVEEVTDYLQAFRLVQDKLRDAAGLPISVRLLCDAHRLLLNGVRGTGKQPGELRRSQNWIGGTRPGNAVFVPPPADRDIVALTSLVAADRRRLLQHPKAGPASYRLFELLPTMPRFSVERVRVALNTTFPTASAAVKVLEDLAIVTEVTGQKKNRSFSYQAYIDQLTC